MFVLVVTLTAEVVAVGVALYRAVVGVSVAGV